jgi:hypothetical protein
MSARSVTGTPPFGSSPLPSLDHVHVDVHADAESAAAPAKGTGGLPDGLEDHGTRDVLGGARSPVLDGLGEAPYVDRLPGGLAAGPAALAKVGNRELAVDDSPGLFAQVTAGFSVLDGCADVASTR